MYLVGVNRRIFEMNLLHEYIYRDKYKHLCQTNIKAMVVKGVKDFNDRALISQQERPWGQGLL